MSNAVFFDYLSMLDIEVGMTRSMSPNATKALSSEKKATDRMLTLLEWV